MPGFFGSVATLTVFPAEGSTTLGVKGKNNLRKSPKPVPNFEVLITLMHPVEVFRQNGERVNPNSALLEHHSQTKQPHSSIFIDIDTFSQGAFDFGQQFNRNISIDVVLVEDNELKP